MKLINKTKNKLVTANLKCANSFSDKLFGLLKEKKGTSLLVKTRFGIHTLFMDYPISVVILNNRNQVVKIKENLLPNSFFFWNPKYKTVIEMPIQKKLAKINSGDFLFIE